jgi:hypothetical protein
MCFGSDNVVIALSRETVRAQIVLLSQPEVA